MNQFWPFFHFFFFIDSCTWKFQCKPAQTWTKKLQTVIFLISINILGCFKFLQRTSDTFFQVCAGLRWHFHVPGYMKIWFFFQRKPAQTWTKRLQTVIFLIFITILGYFKFIQSTSDTFFPSLHWFALTFSCTRVHENLIFFQRKPAQTWTKRLQTVIFLISITILGYFKFIQSTYDTFIPSFRWFALTISAQTWEKSLQTVIFFISIAILGCLKFLQTTSDTFFPSLRWFALTLSCTRIH